MARLGEIVRGAVLDSVGINGVRAGWDNSRELFSNPFPPVVISAVVGVESFTSPNIIRDTIVEDYVSTTSEFIKSYRSLAASVLLDTVSWAGAIGVGLLTKQIEAAIAAKIGLNVATSAVIRTADSIHKQRIARTTA